MTNNNQRHLNETNRKKQVGDQVGQFGQGQGQETMVTMGLYDYSVTPGPFFYFELLKRRNLQVSNFEKLSGGGVGWGGLFDYSVYSWPRFCHDQG